MSRLMNIGEAARAAGVSAKMIRHYEQIGLVPAAARTGSGYRQYAERDVSILRFIRQSRRLGFSIDQIAGLLNLWSNSSRTSRQVKTLAQTHLDALEDKMREISEMHHALQKLVLSCHGNDDPDCVILDELAVDSPVAPDPFSVGSRPIWKSRRKAVVHRDPVEAVTDQHVDLMAWAHGIRAVRASGAST